MKWKVPLFKSYWDEDDIESVAKVIRRGNYWATGPEITELEDKIAKFVGTKYAVVFNSGTSALHASLLAFGVSKGDEVIVPSLSFISTANSVLFMDAKPVFADIENKTYALDAEDVKEKITSKTKGIIPVHYGGIPCHDINKIVKIAKDHNLFVLEDAAAALGAKIADKKVGRFGDATMFSFCQSKIITTGEGGAIVTGSADIYKKLKLIVSHGKNKGKYECLGYNFRMPSMNASLGISQINKIDKLINKRREVAKYYNSKLKNIKNLELIKPPKDFLLVYWIYTIIVKNNLRNELRKHLLEKEIFSKLYYDPIHLTKFYKEKFGYKKGMLPNTEKFCDNSLSLPMFPHLYKKDIDYIVRSIFEKMER
ncbi:MAG: DegT/DnrJ/EryC1/StrS family aminotransferase [Thermoplasmatales archaeon]|nr:DegT/DnrJ/EryC1/StrS family aminotransferase [Thermoplasmatales archaeon]